MIEFLHSSWAIIVILMFIITLSHFLSAYFKNRIFSYQKDFRIASFTFIVLTFQVILGLAAWFSSPYFTGIQQGHMRSYLQSAHDRLLVLEHPLMMLIAWGLVYIGFLRMKKAPTSKKKFMAVILLYGLGFLFIISRIPWRNWL